MSELERSQVSEETKGSAGLPSLSRRTILKGMAGAGAAVSLMSRSAWANGEIGFWAKDLPNDKLTEMFNTICRIRWHERTMVDKMITDPKYRGYNHFYAGQEAVAVGVCSALNNKGPFDQLDLVYSTHRPTGHAIAKGVDMKKMAAENDFRATGLNGGYGGEMHLSDKSCGFIGADGMIGPGHVIATGSAFAFRARGSKQVAVVFGGDGTYATPHFHSALNNAALLDLPFIYVLENNLYHQYAHYSYSCPMKDIADAARTYRIPGVVVDGQDVFQVYNAAKTAVDRARRPGSDPDRGEDLPLLQPLGRAWRRGRSARCVWLRPAGDLLVPSGTRGARLDAARSRGHLPQHPRQLGRADSRPGR